MAQQLGPSVEAATSPFQCALSTPAGGECVAHALQGICEVNPNTTILSIDGISTFDAVSRVAMLDGLHTLVGGEALPFVRMFHGTPLSYIWEDAEGVEHTMWQGEGGEQGDTSKPLLFSLGQHTALAEAQDDLEEGEFLFACLDDIYVAIPRPDRVGAVHASLQEHLQSCARIHIHGGKTQVWNSAGVRPAACNVLEHIAQVADPKARVGVGQERQICLRLSRGSLCWAPHWVTRHLSRAIWRRRWQSRGLCWKGSLLCMICSVAPLFHCATAQANHLVEPQATERGIVCATFCTQARSKEQTPEVQRICPLSLED